MTNLANPLKLGGKLKLDEIRPTELFKTALKLLKEEKTIESAGTFRMALESCLKDIQRITKPDIKRKKDERIYISRLNRELLRDGIYNKRWFQKLGQFTKHVGNEAVHVTRKITLKELEEAKDLLKTFFLVVYFPIRYYTFEDTLKFKKDCLFLENNIFYKIIQTSSENLSKIRNFNEDFYIITQIDEFLLAKISNQNPESLKTGRIILENDFREFKMNLLLINNEIYEANRKLKKHENNNTVKKLDCIPVEPIFLILNMLLELSMIFEYYNEESTRQTSKDFITAKNHYNDEIFHNIDFNTNFQQLKLGIKKLILNTKLDSLSYLGIIKEYTNDLEETNRSNNKINDFLIYAQISEFKKRLNKYLIDFESFLHYRQSNKGFFLEGKAGTGKSYHILNLIRNLTNTEKQFPYIYLRGIDFNKQEPLVKQILALLDCKELKFTEIIEKLILYGMYCQCSIPFIIDGLNEAERFSIWKELHSISKSLGSQWITPIFSSRPLSNPSYRNHIPKNLNLIKFDNHIDENKLIKSYSEYFNITIDLDHRLHVTPFITYISCVMAKRNNQNYVFLTNLSLIDVLKILFRELEDLYIERTNSVPNKFWVNETLDKIAEKIIETKQTTISKQSLMELSKKHFKTWENSVIKFLIEEEIILSNEDNISFSTQVFQDFIVANYISKQKIDIKEIFELLEIEASWIDDIIRNYLILNSIMLNSNDINLLTKIKINLTGKYNQLIRKVAFLNASVFPYLERFNDKQIDIIESVYTLNPSLRKDIIDKLIRYGLAKPDQTRTFYLIENLLKDINMIDRDLLFGENLRKNPTLFLKVISQLEYQGNPNFTKNLLTLLKWFLTSNVERIRYISTKQLVQLGRKSPSSFIDVFYDSIFVDDLYIIEGMVSSLLGVLITQREELKPEFTRINDLIINRIFQKGKFEHLKVRDYAFQILSLINEYRPDPALFSVVSKELSANRNCIKDNDINHYIKLLGFKYAPHSIEVPMIFLDKICKNLGEEFTNESKTICQLWQYLNYVGYDFWKTGRVDNSIDPLDIFNYVKTERGQKLVIEKWARKYSRIAYDILAAKRIGKLLNMDRIYLNLFQFRDYDITFPEIKEIQDIFPFLEDLSDKWIEKCNYNHFLGNSNLIDNSTEWILVEMFYSKQIRMLNAKNNVYHYYFQIDTNSEVFCEPKIDNLDPNTFSDQIVFFNVYSNEYPSRYILRHPSINKKIAWTNRWNSLRGFDISPHYNTKTIIFQPIPPLVSKFNLNQIRGGYDWSDEKGDATTCRIIETDNGQVFSGFFIRKDLLQEYLGSRTIVTLSKCTKGFIRIEDGVDKHHQFRYHYEIGKLDKDFHYYGHCCYHVSKNLIQLIQDSTQDYIESSKKRIV